MADYALRPEAHGTDIEKSVSRIHRKTPDLGQWYDSLRSCGALKDTFIIGEGSHRLHAVYAQSCHPESAAGTAVVIHGYTSNHIEMLHIARMYRDSLNFNILVPDLHYHGLSEGVAIQMGWLDRLDIKRWCNTAHGIWNNDFMIIHGISMGAATTMMFSGEPDLPSYIKGFVEDCGYSDVRSQFEHIMSQRHMPHFLLDHANRNVIRRFGWDIDEASSLKQLSKCTLPMLFIHGDGDNFVPTSNIYKCFNAKTQGYGEFWVVEDTARHAASYDLHPAEYTARVRSFIDTIHTLLTF